jgi:hypothetical protein
MLTGAEAQPGLQATDLLAPCGEGLLILLFFWRRFLGGRGGFCGPSQALDTTARAVAHRQRQRFAVLPRNDEPAVRALRAGTLQAERVPFDDLSDRRLVLAEAEFVEFGDWRQELQALRQLHALVRVDDLLSPFLRLEFNRPRAAWRALERPSGYRHSIRICQARLRCLWCVSCQSA